MSKFRFWVVLVTTVPAVQSGVAFAGPPCPFHTIEGSSGGAITPMACLVNSDPICEGAVLGKPTVALSYVNLGNKNLDAITYTQAAWGRIEFGYAANRLGLGSLPREIRDATTVDVHHSDLWLHHFNLRALLLEDGDCLGGFAMPALAAGVHVKYNDAIHDVNNRLGGALTTIGYDRDTGVDFTVTATKAIPPEILGRPVMVTGGVRASQAAQLGLLGFGDDYYATFEGSVVCFATDKLVLAYEFRQKPDPYGQIPGLIGDEDHWHGFDAALILSDHTTFCAGYGLFGTVANTEEDGVWWLQLKFEL